MWVEAPALAAVPCKIREILTSVCSKGCFFPCMICLCSYVCRYYIPRLVVNTKRKLQQEAKISLVSSCKYLSSYRGQYLVAMQTLQMWLVILQIHGYTTSVFKHLCPILFPSVQMLWFATSFFSVAHVSQYTWENIFICACNAHKGD